MSRKQQDPPLLADPTAAPRLEAAAAAAGVTVQELADLVFEAGVVPPKAPDGITQRYTLEDLGARLWGTMQTVPRSKRAEWFAGLVPTQRISVIVVLRDQGFRTEVVANELGVPPDEVMRAWNNYGSQLGAQVLGIRLDTIAGQMQLASERAQQIALENGMAAVYWRIEKEKVELLQSLGVVDRAAHRMEVTHKLSDEQRGEIEKIAELRNKQGKRRIEIEEIKQISEKGDAMPAEVSEDYDEEDD